MLGGKNIFQSNMSCFPLLAPFQAVRKQLQRRTSLYSGPHIKGAGQFQRRSRSRAAGDRWTGGVDERRAGRGDVEGRDTVPPELAG